MLEEDNGQGEPIIGVLLEEDEGGEPLVDVLLEEEDNHCRSSGKWHLIYARRSAIHIDAGLFIAIIHTRGSGDI